MDATININSYMQHIPSVSSGLRYKITTIPLNGSVEIINYHLKGKNRSHRAGWIKLHIHATYTECKFGLKAQAN